MDGKPTLTEPIPLNHTAFAVLFRLCFVCMCVWQCKTNMDKKIVGDIHLRHYSLLSPFHTVICDFNLFRRSYPHIMCMYIDVLKIFIYSLQTPCCVFSLFDSFRWHCCCCCCCVFLFQFIVEGDLSLEKNCRDWSHFTDGTFMCVGSSRNLKGQHKRQVSIIYIRCIYMVYMHNMYMGAFMCKISACCDIL